MTLAQSIEQFISNITITDKQTTNISSAYGNLQHILVKTGNGLFAVKTFQQGSYDRDTIIRPLDDIDIFLVLNPSPYSTHGQLENSQNVLSKLRSYLDVQHDYKGKVKQDRPCITITLSDKRFDILPCFGDDFYGYKIPAHDLKGWTTTNPVKHSNDLTRVNGSSSGNIVPAIRAIKHWNREKGKIIPSYHIEEIAIKVFGYQRCTSKIEVIHKWFAGAQTYLNSAEFKSYDEYLKASSMIRTACGKIEQGYKYYQMGYNDHAVQEFKNVFGTSFSS